MAYNYLDITNEALKRINEVQLTSSTFGSAVGIQGLAKDAVNNSQRDIFMSEQEWPFAYAETSQTLTAGTKEYSLTTGFLKIDIDTVLIDRNDDLNVEETHLTPLSYQEYIDRYKERDEQRDSGDFDTPRFVYLTPDYKLGVSPTPDKAYVVKYTYFKTATELSNATDVPEVSSQFKNTLIDGTMYHLYMMRDNAELAALSRRNFDEGIEKMRTILINRYIRMRDTRVSHVINDW